MDYDTFAAAGRRRLAILFARLGVRVDGVTCARGPRLMCFGVATRDLVATARAERASVQIARALGVRAVRVGSTPSGVVVEVPLHPSLWKAVGAGDAGGKGLAVGVGISPTGRAITVALDDPSTPHLGVYGSTGSGKTEAVRALVWQLVTGNDPADVRLILIDGKGGGFGAFEGAPHLLHPVITGAAEGGAVLEYIADRVRARAFGGAHVVVVVDEVADLVDAWGGIDGRAGRALTALCTLGRGLDAHVILATQHPRADTIGRLAGANVRARLVGACSDGAASRLCTGLEERPGSVARSLHGAGDMVLVIGDRVRRVQAPMVTAEEWAELPGGPQVDALPLEPAEEVANAVHFSQAPAPLDPADLAAVLADFHGRGTAPGVQRTLALLRARSGACGTTRARRVRDAAGDVLAGLRGAGLELAAVDR